MKIHNNYNGMSAEIEDITLRIETSHRGGGIEIDLEPLGFESGSKMSAYQNYLGGGMLGSVCSDCNVTDWTQYADLCEIAQDLKKYFASLTSDADFESLQERPASAY